MFCWKCGKEIIDDASFCSYCGAEQKKAAPRESPGAILRRAVKEYGEVRALTEPELLPQALLQAQPEAERFARRLRMALEEGVGTMYLTQLPQGGPDTAFLRKVESILSEQVGFSDAVAREVTDCLNEALGWPARGAKPSAPKSAAAPEPPKRPAQENAAPAAPETKPKKAKRFTWKSLLITAAVLLLARLIGYGVGRLMAKDLRNTGESAGSDYVQSSELIGSTTQNADGSYTWNPPESTYTWPTLDPIFTQNDEAKGPSIGVDWTPSDNTYTWSPSADSEEDELSTALFHDIGSGLRCYLVLHYDSDNTLTAMTAEYIGRTADGFTAQKMRSVGVESSFPSFVEIDYGESSQGFAYVTARMTGLTSASRVQELQRYDMIPTGSAFDAPMKAYDLMESYWANGWESASSEDYGIIRDIEAGRA